ncbi:RloB family protein [Helicobacter pullorum]|uniref:RloB family protein n=1 Tax=Helicobacter pullorum TaxID=35818 RepID=UPI000816976C|nr:RloB family protein [Helicobacter pullorum]OCR08012.1 hypothetical protein A7X13_08160 [Helicobacter pullorum]
MRNKRIKTKISIWCEGKTELNYFDSIKSIVAKENISIKCEEIEKKSYKNIWIKLDKEKDLLYDKIFIVIDLDRANNDETEMKNLKKLISTIKKSKGQAFLFLSYENFEAWLMYHFKDNSRNSKANFLKTMGFESSKDFKANSSNLYKQILAKGGSIENAEDYFRKRGLFCDRECSINRGKINSIQSNLYYFRELIEEMALER